MGSEGYGQNPAMLSNQASNAVNPNPYGAAQGDGEQDDEDAFWYQQEGGEAEPELHNTTNAKKQIIQSKHI